MEGEFGRSDGDHAASVALLEVTREQVGIAHCGSTLVCRARGGQLD